MSRIFIWPSCASLKSDCSNPAVSINLTFHSTSYYGLNFTQDRSAASIGASLVSEVTRSVSQEKEDKLRLANSNYNLNKNDLHYDINLAYYEAQLVV
jgi:hypothetical protein